MDFVPPELRHLSRVQQRCDVHTQYIVGCKSLSSAAVINIPKSRTPVPCCLSIMRSNSHTLRFANNKESELFCLIVDEVWELNLGTQCWLSFASTTTGPRVAMIYYHSAYTTANSRKTPTDQHCRLQTSSTGKLNKQSGTWCRSFTHAEGRSSFHGEVSTCITVHA